MMNKPWIWVVGILVIVLGWAGISYNRFVTLSAGADTQWSQVEVQLQRRFDLVPNLVASVKGIFTQEKEVFANIADARTRYSGAATVDQKVAAANDYESALGRLLVITENYPQLQSAQNVRSLMDELAGTENRVSVERRRFNETVQEYNVAVSRVPGKLFASLFGYQPRALFGAAPEAQNAPQVSF